MKLERRSLSRLAVPLKALVDRFAFGTLIVASIALLIVGKADVRLLEAVNTRISDAAGAGARRRGAADQRLAPAGRRHRRAGRAAGRERRLREQNARLLEWQSVARQLALENAALRQLLQRRAPRTSIRPRSPPGSSADAGGPFVQTVLVNAGAEQGRRQGHGGGQRARPRRPGDRGRAAQRARSCC